MIPLAGGAALIAAVSAGGVWWALRPMTSESSAALLSRPILPPPIPPAPARPAPVLPTLEQPPLASEAEILADQPDHLAIYRFTPQPSVVVLQFPSLSEQAATLNRVAALIEKAGFPHDSVLSRTELDTRIVASGGEPDTFYYGHDYSAGEIMRFFALAADLDPQEQAVRDLARRLDWGAPRVSGALISLVRLSGAPDVNAAGRAAILRHELSHGFYFTDSAYAEFCQEFWSTVLTADERAKFILFLGREGYDTSISDLMINETQAYLMFTPDPHFFSAAAVGLEEDRVAELRRVFAAAMPQGWLRDHTQAP